MTLLMDTRITVWFERDVPYGLIWEGRHYRVTDTPTRLEDQTGWRFQGSDDDELTRVFDIVKSGAQWEMLRVYV